MNIQISQVLKLYQHTIENVKIFQYHQELDENVDTDEKIVLEDLICLTAIAPRNTSNTIHIINDLREATTLIQLADNSYDTVNIINKLKNAMKLVKEMS